VSNQGRPPAAANGNLQGDAAKANGLSKLVGHGLWQEQLKALSVTLGLAVGMTTLIAYLVKRLLGGLRPSEEVETLGLDLVEHGQEGYHLA
jgi:Amt family ammonium transporter